MKPLEAVINELSINGTNILQDYTHRGLWQMNMGRYSYTFSWYWSSLSSSLALLEATVSIMGSWCVHGPGACTHASSATQGIGSAWWCAGWEADISSQHICSCCFSNGSRCSVKGLPHLYRAQLNL